MSAESRMKQDTSAHSPSLLRATLRMTALVLGASLGFVGVLCGGLLVASATLDPKAATSTSTSTSTVAPSAGESPRALPANRAESAKKPRSSI